MIGLRAIGTYVSHVDMIFPATNHMKYWEHTHTWCTCIHNDFRSFVNYFIGKLNFYSWFDSDIHIELWDEVCFYMFVFWKARGCLQNNRITMEGKLRNVITWTVVSRCKRPFVTYTSHPLFCACKLIYNLPQIPSPNLVTAHLCCSQQSKRIPWGCVV